MKPIKGSVLFEFSFAYRFLFGFSSINNPLIIFQFVGGSEKVWDTLSKFTDNKSKVLSRDKYSNICLSGEKSTEACRPLVY